MVRVSYQAQLLAPCFESIQVKRVALNRDELDLLQVDIILPLAVARGNSGLGDVFALKLGTDPPEEESHTH